MRYILKQSLSESASQQRKIVVQNVPERRGSESLGCGSGSKDARKSDQQGEERRRLTFSLLDCLFRIMLTHLGDVSLYDSKISVYRFGLSGMMLYTVHTKSLIVKGYIVVHGKSFNS